MAQKHKKGKGSAQRAQLRHAIVLEARSFTEEEKKLIDELSPQEVDVLIRMREKWGRAFRGKRPPGFIPV